MIDSELANELITSFDEHYSIIQGMLEQLSHNSDDEQLNNLFRSVHTIKGNAAMANCDDSLSKSYMLENGWRQRAAEPEVSIERGRRARERRDDVGKHSELALDAGQLLGKSRFGGFDSDGFDSRHLWFLSVGND